MELSRKRVHSGDRISNLPDTLLHHILSFLDTQEVLPTSILSKRWKRIPLSSSILSFDYETFCQSLINILMENKISKFIDFVNQYFLRRKTQIMLESFLLVFNIDEDQPFPNKYLHLWVNAALQLQVQKLHLSLGAETLIHVPDCIFNSRTLQELKLDLSLSTHHQHILPTSMFLPNLKTLHLKNIYFHYAIDDIFSSCPILETLILKCIVANNIPKITISNPTLKHLELGPDLTKRVVVICVPSLTYLKLADKLNLVHSVPNHLSSLVSAKVGLLESVFMEYKNVDYQKKYLQEILDILKALSNVRYLTLSSFFYEVFDNLHLNLMPMRFTNLKYLKIKTCFSINSMLTLSRLLLISPKLETLEIEACLRPEDRTKAYLKEVLETFECPTCCLKFLKIQNAIGSTNKFKFIESILKKARDLEKLVITPSKRIGVRYDKVFKFSAASKNLGISLVYL